MQLVSVYFERIWEKEPETQVATTLLRHHGHRGGKASSQVHPVFKIGQKDSPFASTPRVASLPLSGSLTTSLGRSTSETF